jgi:WhiB family redox-sensing transcriptional regulator
VAPNHSVALLDARWEFRAACRGPARELFCEVAAETAVERADRERAAKQICAHCDVLAECRAYALRVHEPLGIWGGMTATERARLLQTVH